MIPITEKGVHKVVQGTDDLERWTSQGWVLAAVLDDATPMSVSETEYLPLPPGQTASYSGGAYDSHTPPGFASVKRCRHVPCSTPSRWCKLHP